MCDALVESIAYAGLDVGDDKGRDASLTFLLSTLVEGVVLCCLG